MERFRTRLFELEDITAPLVAWGQGWCVALRPLSMRFSYDGTPPEPIPEDIGHMRAIIKSQQGADGVVTSKLAPELIIHTVSEHQAGRVLKLIAAAHTLVGMDLLDDDWAVVPDTGFADVSSLDWDLRHSLGRAIAKSGFFRAASIAAKASRRKVHLHAMAKFFYGFRISGIHWMDTHPKYGDEIRVSRDPMMYVGYAQAIIAFFSVLEELNLHVIASSQRPSKLKDGRWNPEVLADLKARLSEAGIDPETRVVWLLRGTPDKIELTHRPPTGDRAAWSRGFVRDREIPICDAIHYAGLLRSRVSAHRVSSRTRSLTSAHVSSVQMLARTVLLAILERQAAPKSD